MGYGNTGMDVFVVREGLLWGMVVRDAWIERR